MRHRRWRRIRGIVHGIRRVSALRWVAAFALLGGCGVSAVSLPGTAGEAPAQQHAAAVAVPPDAAGTRPAPPLVAPTTPKSEAAAPQVEPAPKPELAPAPEPAALALAKSAPPEAPAATPTPAPAPEPAAAAPEKLATPEAPTPPKAERTAPEVDVPLILEQAQFAFEEGRLEDAARLLEKLIEADPGLADAYYRLALVRESQGELERALGIYRRLLTLQPGPLWQRLVNTRIDQIAYGLAFNRMLSAERYAATGRREVALDLLASSLRLEPPASIERVIRDRYYRILAEDLARQVEQHMFAAVTHTLAVAPAVVSGRGDAESARRFQARLLFAFAGNGAVDAVRMNVQPTLIDMLLQAEPSWDLRELVSRESALREYDCILVGRADEKLGLRLYNVTEGRYLWDAAVKLAGPVPPTLFADAWRTLVYRPFSARSFRADLWPAEPPAAGENLALRYRAAQACHIILLACFEDGGMRVLVPASPDDDNFVLAAETGRVTVDTAPLRRTVGFVLIGARSPLDLPAEVVGRRLSAAQSLPLAKSIVDELESRDAATVAETYWAVALPPDTGGAPAAAPKEDAGESPPPP